MDRITMRDLEATVRRINTICGTPQQPYELVLATDDKPSRYEPQARCYHLSGAYGGYSLQQMCDTGSGVRSIIEGYRPKRELYELMHAYIRGMESSRKAA